MLMNRKTNNYRHFCFLLLSNQLRLYRSTKNLGAISLMLFVSISTSSARVWETSAPGNWDDPEVWLENQTPEEALADTFIINHPLHITQQLLFSAGARIFIEENGGICGHQKLTLETQTKLESYGILELDSLVISGGYAYFFDGFATLTHSALLTGGGMVLTGASLAVGPWFNCRMPNYDFLQINTIEKNQSEPYLVFPNPLSHQLTIKTAKSRGNIKVTILGNQGQKIVDNDYPLNHQIMIDLSPFSSGIYFLIIEDNESLQTTKLIKQ